MQTSLESLFSAVSSAGREASVCPGPGPTSHSQCTVLGESPRTG